MKYMRLILITLLIILGLSSDSLALLRVPSHVAFYRFENAVTDDSGRGNNGTNSGTTDVAGKFGRARNFDGIDDKITVTANYKLPALKNNTAYSITFWAKLVPDTTKRTIYGEVEVGVIENLGISKSTANKCRIYIESSTGNKLAASSTTTIADNTWHFIGWTDDNGTANLYIDSVPDATNFNYTKSGTFSGTVVTMGNEAAGGADWAKGDIDEPMFFDKALTQAEIKSLMLGFSPGEF